MLLLPDFDIPLVKTFSMYSGPLSCRPHQLFDLPNRYIHQQIKAVRRSDPGFEISALSSAEFLGMVTDDLQQKIVLKTFHCEIINDHKALQQEQDNYKEIPVFRGLESTMVERNYNQIKEDVKDIVTYEMVRILQDPALGHCQSVLLLTSFQKRGWHYAGSV